MVDPPVLTTKLEEMYCKQDKAIHVPVDDRLPHEHYKRHYLQCAKITG